jgi:exonuclease III
MRNFTALSLNCQGLGDTKKRRDVFQFLRQKEASVYFLSDTHFKPSMEKFIRSEWGFECCFSSNNSQSRGVAILFNNNFDFKITKKITDKDGNFLIVKIKTSSQDIVLINVYGPNRDNPTFYQNLQNILKQFENCSVIIAGDWNLVMDPTLDYHNYKHTHNIKAQEEVVKLSNEFQLVDIWREINSEIRRYTWRRTNPQQQARLDFFLISETLLTFVKSADIQYGYRSDHSIISLELAFTQETQRTTSWKFNSSLLKDHKYVEEINTTITKTKIEYAASPYDPNNINSIPLQDLQLTISDQLFLDVLIMNIRTKTIEYSSKKKKEIDQKEKQLINDIQQLDQLPSRNEKENQEFHDKTNELNDIRQTKMDGILLRSKARWASQGEKVTKYFCNLEKRHFISKQMFKLINKDGNCLASTDDMLNETKDYFHNLYSARPVEDTYFDDFVQTLPKLTDEESELLEGLITLEEASVALKNMPNGKSPGTDGITVDFYKFFWKQIGILVVRSLNEGFVKKEMSITQKEGLIISIPKGDKPREYLRNWRPISLLNVSYKIGSTCIANRIKTTLPKLIHEDQSGFVKGRYIGDNLRCIYDLIHYLNSNNLPGLLVLIDFEKAFDSINWSYMHKVLQEFGFKNDICQWIKAFYTNIKSSVTVNGKTSQQFTINRGCRQGDPISPYLFILCAEVLACKIREEKIIKGIVINDKEFKISQFADDTSLTLNDDKRSFEQLFVILEKFEKMSGLKLNYEKTINVWLGSKQNSNDVFLSTIKMDWNPPKFKILGLWFTSSLTGMADLNYDEKLREIKCLFNTWIKRTSTPVGRVAVLKSLILSKLVYLWLLLPNPPIAIINQLQMMCFEFVWDYKRDKVKRKTTTRSVKDGGLGLPWIKAFILSLKLTWIKKLFNNIPKWYTILQTYDLNMVKIQKLGPQYFFNLNNINPFWKDAFSAYRQFYDKISPTTCGEILMEPLFYNNKFTIDNKIFHFKHWTDKGIFLVKDLVDETGNFLPYTQFNQKHGIKTHFLEYFSCISSIKKYLSRVNIKIDNNVPENSTKAYKMTVTAPKGCKMFYSALIESNESLKFCKKWDTLMEEEINWTKVFLKTHKINEIKLKWFQMRINYRIIVTNAILKNMGIAESANCSFCNVEKDSALHFLWACPHTQNFWSDFTKLLKEKCTHCDRLKLNKTLIMFGCSENVYTDNGFDFILLHAKFYIYKCKFSKTNPCINAFLNYLKYQYVIDEYIHKIEMKHDKFQVKWLMYNGLLELS